MAKKKVDKLKEKVRVHSCFDIELGEPFPTVCACRQLVDMKTARGMVGRHEAEWIKGTEHSNVCLIGGLKRRTPRTATIDDKHIKRAYIDGDLEECHRINEYGILNFLLLRQLFKWVSAAEFDAKKKTDWGTPALSFIEDNTTEGGRGKDKHERN